MNEAPETEGEHAASADLDLLETQALVELLVRDQRAAVEAVLACAPAIAAVADAVAERLARGGRLRYVGAGTSGRIASLDAAEMPPTFGVARTCVRASIAGGSAALQASVEGAEDDAIAGAAQFDDANRDDAVIGLSASGGAPFVVAALARARQLGAFTVAIANVIEAPLYDVADARIVLRTGAEVLTGSTRLKAGTAQKIALNAISTAVMVRLGKVHGNLMVDLVASNRKLRARAVRLVQRMTETDAAAARALLDAAAGSVKVAAVMHRRGLDAEDARRRLAACGERLRQALAE